MAVAAALSDHMLVIRGGQVIEQGATVQLLESAKEDYTKELLAATPRLQKGATDGDHLTCKDLISPTVILHRGCK